jgi:REP element-mobilizing transposase RayT
MPRQLRLDLAHVPQHVVQRGNDRQPCFFETGDFERYRTELREISLRGGCASMRTYLMTNHVHLLMTPTATGQIARVLQALGRRYRRTSTTATIARARSGMSSYGNMLSARQVECDVVVARGLWISPDLGLREKMHSDPEVSRFLGELL